MKNQQSGIYRIRCEPTGKVYVGSSVDIDTRWYQHRTHLRQGNHHNSHLQHAWDKYGADAFTFEVIELVDAGCLLDREQYWMDELRVCDRDYGYNTAETSRGGGPRTAGPGKRIGGEPKPIADLKPVYGKVRVRIDPATEMVIPVDPETRALAQRLMLHEWPGVSTVEELFAYAVRRLASTKMSTQTP